MKKLRLQVRTTVDALHAMGYGHGDRIAISLPNGPGMAVTFLAVASAFTCVPLNPACREQEFETYLSQAGVDAVILPSGASPMSSRVPVITLSPSGSEAGAFTIAGEDRKGSIDRAYATPGDVGLLLQTSGTTSRPKLVPLTQSGMVAAALNMAVPLALSREDRCLNVSPLYYVGGLLGSLLGTIATGGSVVCTPGFQPERFFEWVRTFHPTWYTSVPAIHQRILQLAAERPDDARTSGLRLIRTSAAAMPHTVRQGLEDLFGVPVIEAYGMTEAPHQIATNPLPPLPRKAGSVGRGVGVEIAIVDDCGHIMRSGGQGEVVIEVRASLAATRTIRWLTLWLFPAAGSTPATWGTWTRTATCLSTVASKKPLTGAATRYPRRDRGGPAVSPVGIRSGRFLDTRPGAGRKRRCPRSS